MLHQELAVADAVKMYKRADEMKDVNEGPYTHSIGPYFFKRVVTTEDVFNLCVELEATFGPGYVFLPEPITEGGILMESWPGKLPEHYKSMRFHAKKPECFERINGRWPIIDQNNPSRTLEDWGSSNPEVIWKDEREVINQYGSGRGKTKFALGSGVWLDTFLKAYYGAPCWTVSELSLVAACFEKVGFERIKKGKLLPQGAKLVQTGELGGKDTSLGTR
jgi:hypothetical protein